MDSDVRSHLRRALGFCSRHTWLYAIVEVELWEGEVGALAGHQPFDTCVLYADLLNAAVLRLDRSRKWCSRGNVKRALRSSDNCLVCRAVRHLELSGLDRTAGYGNSDTLALTEQVNCLRHTQCQLAATEPLWHSLVCPLCRADASVTLASRARAHGTHDPSAPTSRAAPVVCRPHLLASWESVAAGPQCLMADLRSLHIRLDRLLDSMTHGAGPAGESDRSAWIETLGWFAGWALPLAILSGDRGF